MSTVELLDCGCSYEAESGEGLQLNAELAEVEKWACCGEPSRRVHLQHRVRQLEAAMKMAKEAIRDNLSMYAYKNEQVLLEAFQRFESLGI